MSSENSRFQPVPCLLARLVRRLRVSIRKRWFRSKKTLLSFGRSVSKLAHWPSRERRGGVDLLEAGRSGSQKEKEPTQQELSPAESGEDAKKRFEESLQPISDNNYLRIITDVIRLWETGR